MKLKNFRETVFMKYAQEIYPKHIEIFLGLLDKRDMDRVVDFQEIGDESEKYIKRVIVLYLIIHNEIEKIKSIPQLLVIDEIPKQYKINKIEEIEYFRMLIEYFHVKIVSTIDYCCNLINHTFQIGYPNRECNAQSLIKNKRIKGTETCEKLKEFVKEFQNLLTDRNIIIHEGDFKNNSLEELDSAIIDFSDEKGMELSQLWFDKKKKEKIENTVTDIIKKIDRVEFHVNEIIESMVEIVVKFEKFHKI